MAIDLRATLAKDFIETAVSPTFDSYNYQGRMICEETGEEMPNTSVHLVHANGKSFFVTYDGNTGVVTVKCVNADSFANVLSASYDDNKHSWTFEGVFTEDLYGSTIIHACRVIKRLHELSLDM